MTMPNSNPIGHTLHRASPKLNFDDAIEVWKRYFLGEKQHHIAQAFGVNQGRISEILKEHKHVGSRIVALGTNPAGRRGIPIQ